MADLRIVDAPVLLQESITDDVKMPTGGLGNYTIRLGDIVWYVVTKEQLANKNYVDLSSKDVQDKLDSHIANKNNPHEVTKEQAGLGNVDNTADLDKPISKAVSEALMTKADIADTYTKNETDNKISALSATTYAGHNGYATLALAQAAQASLTANTIVEVTNDTPTNNGVYLWNGTTLTKSNFDVLGQAKAYVDSNPFFKVRNLTTGENLNNLTDGIYRIPSTAVGNSLLNLPSGWQSEIKLGTIVVYRLNDTDTNKTGVAYQRAIHYNNIKLIFERVGNGGSTTFAWGEWKIVANKEDLESLISKKPTTNLFINPILTADDSTQYQAIRLIEGVEPVLSLNPNGLVYYEQDINGDEIAEGNTVTLSVDMFCDVVGLYGCDISIQALNINLQVLATSASVNVTAPNTYQNNSVSLILPPKTARVRVRLIRRTNATVAKFKNVVLTSNSVNARLYNPHAKKRLVYVSKSGLDVNNGNKSLPYLTIQKAVNVLNNTGGVVVILDSEIYRETVLINSPYEITLMCARNQRAKIFGSNQLIVTKTTGYTKVYQAQLSNEPTGMGAPRGLPTIFEWGTPSSLIETEYQHELQRGRTHRLPYTAMYKATSLAELDTPEGNGKWFWEGGIIYFAATDGSDATLKQYETRARRCIYFGGNKLNLYRIDCYFSKYDGFWLEGVAVHREDCGAYGNQTNGFSDNSHSTMSIRDQAVFNGNDGFNGTVTNYTSADELTSIHANYIDPYSALNGDDGISYHIRGTCNIDGGYIEFNQKAGVVHVTGGGGTCKDTITVGQINGFYAATASLDGRKGSTISCINTIAKECQYAYRTEDDAKMLCLNTVAHNPRGIGYLGNSTNGIDAIDCKYSGDSAKAKSGNVIVTTTSALT